MIEITLQDKYEIEFGPSDERVEVIQNVRTILNELFFGVINHRNFGLNATYLDAPIQTANILSRADIIEKIEKDEPRAKVESVSFKGDGLTGYTNPIVRISINV
jgi:uncharacterized protein